MHYAFFAQIPAYQVSGSAKAMGYENYALLPYAL
jgi:hypothetical protein